MTCRLRTWNFTGVPPAYCAESLNSFTNFKKAVFACSKPNALQGNVIVCQPLPFNRTALFTATGGEFEPD